MDRTSAVLRAGELQIRPVLMTCVIAGVGLQPAAISTAIGSQVQKPLAVVVVGGMALAPGNHVDHFIGTDRLIFPPFAEGSYDYAPAAGCLNIGRQISDQHDRG